jgi:membrane protease YdiL (CAAX protease family)
LRRESPVCFAGPLAPKSALAFAAVVLAVTLPLVALGVLLELVEMRPIVPGGHVFAVLAASALIEEWLFRGYLQSRLERVLPPRTRLLGASLGAAWLLTALLFGLAHWPAHGPLGALARVAPGLVFGFCRARAGSIWPGWVVHVAYNVVGGMLAR